MHYPKKGALGYSFSYFWNAYHVKEQAGALCAHIIYIANPRQPHRPTGKRISFPDTQSSEI